MKLGFAFKKPKKGGLLAAAAVAASADGATVARAFDAAPVKPNDEAARVYVTDFDPTAVAPGGDDDAKKTSTLVIPLLKTNAWKAQQKLVDELTGEQEQEQETQESDATVNKKPTDTEPEGVEMAATEQLTEDEVVAQQLLADVKAQQHGDERTVNETLVIPMKQRDAEPNDPLAATRAKLFKLETETKEFKGVPILQQNAVPGLDELADVTEKYRHDVALRPDALDVHSEVYEAVPVEDFGAAMLRGMGWKGTAEDEDKDADDPKPRQKLLGLGATAKPKLLDDKSKHSHNKAVRRMGESKPRSNGLNQREEARHSSKSEAHRDGREDAKTGRGHDKNESSRTRSRSRERGNETDRRSSRPSDREEKSERRRERGREYERDRERGRERGRDDRDRSRGRRDDRDRERHDDRSRRDDREKRKRSRSRDRSSEKKSKKSSSRR